MSPPGQNTDFIRRVQFPLLLLVLTPVLVAGLLQNLAGAFGPGASEPISAREPHWDALRSTLKPGITVGYVTDRDPANVETSRERAISTYELAPVAIVPVPAMPARLIDPRLAQDENFIQRLSPSLRHAAPEWFVGDFADSSRAGEIARRNQLTITRDFGDGVMLLQRSPE